jgi:hypothetical protein
MRGRGPRQLEWDCSTRKAERPFTSDLEDLFQEPHFDRELRNLVYEPLSNSTLIILEGEN